MFKPVKQSDRELSRQATAILHKHGISRAAFIRSALEAVVEKRTEKLQFIIKAAESAEPKQRCSENIYKLQEQYRQIMAPEEASILDKKGSREEKTRVLQARTKRFLGGQSAQWSEEEKKAFFDDLSGGL